MTPETSPRAGVNSQPAAPPGVTQKRIVNQMKEGDKGKAWTPRELADALDLTTATTNYHLAVLMEKGAVRRVKRGVYALSKPKANKSKAAPTVNLGDLFEVVGFYHDQPALRNIETNEIHLIVP